MSDGRRSNRFRILLPIAVGTLAALAVAFFVGLERFRHPDPEPTEDDEFTAPQGVVGNSGDMTPLQRSVTVIVQTMADDLNVRTLDAGATIEPNIRFIARYRNANASKQVIHAIVFAVDAKGVVRWIYPAVALESESEETDPASIALQPTEGDRDAPMGMAVAFEHLNPGRLSIVTMLSREPLHVSRIERRALMDIDALRGDFPTAEVSSFEVDVATSR